MSEVVHNGSNPPKRERRPAPDGITHQGSSPSLPITVSHQTAMHRVPGQVRTAHRTYVLFNVHNLVGLMPSSCPAWGDQRPERKRDSPRTSSEQQIQGSHQVCLTPMPVPLTLLFPRCSDTSNFKPHKPQNNSLLLLSTIKTMG